mgnify:CR=1 FL=1
MGNIPGVGPGVVKDHQIANPERVDLNPAGKDILGCAQLANHGDRVAFDAG